VAAKWERREGSRTETAAAERNCRLLIIVRGSRGGDQSEMDKDKKGEDYASDFVILKMIEHLTSPSLPLDLLEVDRSCSGASPHEDDKVE